MTTIYFRVQTVRPDQRQYRQTSLELQPAKDLFIAFDVDDEHLAVDNGMLVITPEGAKELMDAFVGVFVDEDESDEGWE